MEQDIKILERMLKIEKECLHYDVSQDEIRTIEHLIKAYKELEEENKKKSIEIICYQEELENSIPVSLVEETIEEKKQEKNKFGNCLVEFYENELADRDIKILQELLERRK